MLPKQMINSVKQAVNAIASNKWSLFTDADIIDALNQAQEEFVEKGVANLMESKPGYNNNDKFINQMRTLVKSNYRIPTLVPNVNVPPDGDMYRPNLLYSVLPEDFMYFLSSDSIVQYVEGAECEDSDSVCVRENAHKEYIAVMPYEQLVNSGCIDLLNFKIVFKNQWNGTNYSNNNVLFDIRDYPELKGLKSEEDKFMIIRLFLDTINRYNSTPEWTAASFNSSFNPSYDINEFGIQSTRYPMSVYWEYYRGRYFKNSFVFVTTNAVEVASQNNMIVTNYSIVNTGTIASSYIEIYGKGFSGVTISDISIGSTPLTAGLGGTVEISDTVITISGQRLIDVQTVIAATGNFDININNPVSALSQQIRYYVISNTNAIGTRSSEIGISGSFEGIFVELQTGEGVPVFSGLPNSNTYTYSIAEGLEGTRGVFREFNFRRPVICTSIVTDEVIVGYHNNRFLKQENISRTLDSTTNKPIKTRPICTLSNGDFLFIYTDGTFIVSYLLLNYVKKPRRISLKSNQSCELPDSAHQEIVNRASEIILLSVADTKFQAQQQRNQITE
jgi:hypothetical protein